MFADPWSKKILKNIQRTSSFGCRSNGTLFNTKLNKRQKTRFLF